MPTYATAADCLTYIEGLTIDDADAFDRLIERAERQVDSALGARKPDDTTGLKFNPVNMTSVRKAALMRATCAQVEYRMTMGEAHFVRPQFGEVSGPDYSTKGKLPRIGPKVWDELQSSDLLRLTTTWHGQGDEPTWSDFAYG